MVNQAAVPVNTRAVTLCPDLVAPPAFKNVDTIVLWDYENHSVTRKLATTISAQMKAFLLFHGYEGQVDIQAFKAAKSKVSRNIWNTLERRGVTVSHVDSTAHNAADDLIINEMLVIVNRSVVVLLSSDDDFSETVDSLVQNGFHVIVVYNPNAISIAYQTGISTT